MSDLCPVCHGTGRYGTGYGCPTCGGTGEVGSEPDRNTQ